MATVKYSREILQEAVKDSKAVSHVLQKLGLKMAGGTHTYVSNLLKKYNIDTSHFLGSRCNLGKPSTNKKDLSKIFRKRRSGYREKTYHLRAALLRAGVPHRCNQCGLGPEWNGKKLCLQVNHINGDFLDDKKENLEFLCPNCHSQTETFNKQKGRLAEQVDAPGLEPDASKREGSNPSMAT